MRSRFVYLTSIKESYDRLLVWAFLEMKDQKGKRKEKEDEKRGGGSGGRKVLKKI